MGQRKVKMMRRNLEKAMEGHLRTTWSSLASLRFRDRVKLAWWMLIGKKELPKKG